jgi:hypothetical protein
MGYFADMGAEIPGYHVEERFAAGMKIGHVVVARVS